MTIGNSDFFVEFRNTANPELVLPNRVTPSKLALSRFYKQFRPKISISSVKKGLSKIPAEADFIKNLQLKIQATPRRS
jgi:hypothetical protein